MTSTAVTGINELVTCDDSTADRLGIRTGAAIVVEDGRVAWIGSATSPSSWRRLTGWRTAAPWWTRRWSGSCWRDAATTARWRR